jgi:hypothetical protein
MRFKEGKLPAEALRRLVFSLSRRFAKRSDVFLTLRTTEAVSLQLPIASEVLYANTSYSKCGFFRAVGAGGFHPTFANDAPVLIKDICYVEASHT